jgi:hypothetical protein
MRSPRRQSETPILTRSGRVWPASILSELESELEFPMGVLDPLLRADIERVVRETV